MSENFPATDSRGFVRMRERLGMATPTQVANDLKPMRNKSVNDRGRAALQGRVNRVKSIWASAPVVVVAWASRVSPRPLPPSLQPRTRALFPGGPRVVW
jgi:hypothetical protein